MNRFHFLTSAFLVATFLGLSGSSADAQEIYKWTDANGTVHYGDRVAAPDSSKKMNITVAPPPQAPAVQASSPIAQHRSPLLPHLDMSKKSVPVASSLVGPECKGLIEKIAAVPAGKNWESLYRQFNGACPGIAYDCVEFESNPQNNQCTWIQRSGSRVLNRSRYP